MESVVTYRGRNIVPDQVAFIRQAIANAPDASRRALSLQICEAWGWIQPNGIPCDALCRGLLLLLERAGHIKLPPARWVARQPRRHEVVARVDIESVPLCGQLSQIGPIEIRQVRRTPEEALVKSLVAQHHYLGYVHPVGEHLKYLFLAAGHPIGCMCWSSAARHLGPRDRHIGWTQEARKANVRFIAYQSRFLILPWVKVMHLASYLLGAVARRLSADWQQVYSHPVYFTETFVEAPRFRGTCYRASNWTLLGSTTGRGKADFTHKPNRPIKQVFGYPLVKDFRQRLCTKRGPD
jgi:hypothetical protein